MSERVSIAEIQQEVLEFLQGRGDVVLHGALAVNVYLDEDDARLTGDADLLTEHPAELAEELKIRLAHKFYIALRVRERADGHLFRIYQIRKPPEKNRHLVDLWRVDRLPSSKRIHGIPVLTIADLIARKVVSCWDRKRSNHPKAGTDERDLSYLLLAYPELKTSNGAVKKCLTALNARPEVLELWEQFVARSINPGGEGE